MPSGPDKTLDIVKLHLLLVEGLEDHKFFAELVRFLETEKLLGAGMIQIIKAGIKRELERTLEDVDERTFSFRTPKVKSIGIIRDADENARGARQSVCRALYSVGLSGNREKYKAVPGKPKVSILILPNNKEPGALETVCLHSVQDDPLMPCVEGFSECVEMEWTKQLEAKQESSPSRANPKEEQRTKILTANLHKMRVRAFLATREDDPERRLGEAAEKGVWDLNHEAFNEIADFLKKLVES